MYKLPVGHAPGSKKNLEPETVLRSPHIFGRLRVAKVPEPTPAPTYLGQLRLRLQAKKAAPGGSIVAVAVAPPPEFCIRPCVPTICSGGIAVVLSVKVAPCQHYLNDVRIKNLLHPR